MFLKGYDILARARTGTGKTGAFVIPIVHGLLELNKHSVDLSKPRALVLAPSRELCSQTASVFKSITSFCTKEVSVFDLSRGSLADTKSVFMSENPNVLISTPKMFLEYVHASLTPFLKTDLKYLVIDEADLMFSFGYKDDLVKILNILPKTGVQSFLMSATLNENVKELKNLVLNKPAILKLEESDLPCDEKLLQYHIQVDDDQEKFVLVNSLFKLGLIVGKTIIFINTVDRCYQLKLFLEQFGIRSCVLNSELPIASRCFVVEQFNADVYDVIIASDENCVTEPQAAATTSKTQSKSHRNKRKSADCGVSRGIDFKYVSNIINFDFPLTVDSYVHRAGRTVRGKQEAEGTILSFVAPKEVKYFEKVAKKFSDKANFKPYQFKMNELEAFRYR